MLVAQTVFAGALFLMAVFAAKPVFLTPLQDAPHATLTSDDIMTTLSADTQVIVTRISTYICIHFFTYCEGLKVKKSIYIYEHHCTSRFDFVLFLMQLGYAPDTGPYKAIMDKVAENLNKDPKWTCPWRPSLVDSHRFACSKQFSSVSYTCLKGKTVLISDFLTGSTEQELNEKLYEKSKGQVLKHHIIWVVWKEKEHNTWKFSIRSTELAYLAEVNSTVTRTLPHNRHLLSGFLAVQLAVSEEILAAESKEGLRHKIKLKAMPISPLMQKEAVRQAMVWVLLCFTVAFIPPVMEVSELVVHETSNEYKRALFMRNVGAACIYLGWLSYLHMTALPILILATLTVILIFRWVWIFVAFVFVAIYITVMAMTAFIVCMFQRKSHIAAIWSALFTLLQLFLADLLVHHGFDGTTSFTVLLHILLPPLGLVHGFHGFALLETGREGLQNTKVYENHTLIIWIMMILAYFGLLMLLQRTIGRDRAVGGQVSWRSIIFKQAEDKNKLRAIQNPLGNERDPLQEVDDLVAKAISFHNVSKSVMGVGVLRRVTLDVYRGEYTTFFAEKIQERMLQRIEDLITGLTLPDDGSVNMLGNDMAALRKAGKRVAAMQGMLGYCHRVGLLVGELTVQETLRFFVQLSLWEQSDVEVEGYTLIHTPRLYKECDLQDVRDVYVRNLGNYYKAQLCWAIAIILEPRIVFIQSFIDGPKYISVINDKIVKYRTHLTIVKISFTTSVLEHADRVFLFDRKILVFGGSPAYMFFKYGREYRVRMTFRVRGSLDNEKVEELVDRAVEMGGQVRAYVGTLLILRLPTSPTDVTAEFVKEITENANHYGITSLNISLPDSEEIHKRAINDSRKQIISYTGYDSHTNTSEQALRELTKPKLWTRNKSPCLNISLLKQTVWKYVSFYIHYRLFLIITMLSAIVTGAIIGVYLSYQLNEMETTISSSRLLGEKMTVEALEQSTTLVLKVYNTDDAISVATGYAMSTTGARSKETQNMFYTALPYTESSSEYLMLRAIDSPQHYVYAYAYGMELKDEGEILDIHVLYSPIHHDTAAAARSLARVYMALLRHYTKTLDADIEVTDDPLMLDSSPTRRKTKVPPLVIHFMLIITIAHITLLPTMEHGLIRHMQVHAMNFSPARYWFSLFCCDIILYWTLVFIITTVLFCVMYWVAPVHFLHRDLIVIPFMLIMYGFSCVPQAYLFSLGPSGALNSMSFVIFNIIFGEASVISQFIQGEAFTYAERALSLSPQYNVANAFVQITKIFVYNSECVIFINKKLCKSNVLHKCCKKCGIMQACFERISYLSKAGIRDEILWTIYHTIIFSSLLIIWEYQVLQRLWYYARKRWFPPEEPPVIMEASGGAQERWDVEAKSRQMKQKRIRRSIKRDTFGENLLVNNLSKRVNGVYKLSRIAFGIGKGEALSLVGQSTGDRLELCEILAGFKWPTSGSTSAMSKWALTTDPHMYSRNVAFSCFEYCPMPPWMTVYDSLWMMGVLRGIPRHYVHEEVANLLDALELDEASNMNVFRLHQNEKTRLNFAVAVIGAPPVLVLDEFTAYQQYSVDRAMFYILYHLRKQGHALLVSSASIENHMAVTNRLGILLNGQLVDVDHIDALVARYSSEGYTVVVHLKDEVDIEAIFARHFENFSVNDVSDVLANVQVKDALNYAEIFSKMEELLHANQTVYSYVITVTAMDYIYNDIIDKGTKIQIVPDEYFWPCLNFLARKKKKVDLQKLLELEKFRKKYDIASLKELPWSVIFRR
ncbi:ABC transporter A family member 5-like [Cydia pomonella]|uniref:ABC transporter A family member 5-like n=1 Tax=Cydia pomonella TaxID=82600 RepID=UPI002ADE92CD|nr:ABC transporter A family member 5-like [Cydia pomonella]